VIFFAYDKSINSDIEFPKGQSYKDTDRAVEQMSNQVLSCEKLIEINTAIIRDSLISFAVAGFDVRFDDDKHLQRVFQYRQIQED
jgi:hypothetical protein